MILDGVLNVLKPSGMTSFDIIAYIRRLADGRTKLGHTGTLDPLACGVLPVCAGNATKAIEYLIGGSKRYRAEITFGTTTDTLDSEGKVIAIGSRDISDRDIVDALSSFKGSSMQLPPAYSAVKVKGRRLYELARKGIDVERTPREVTIHDISLLEYKGVKALIDVTCSKGTYIRSLCYDIGQHLGCEAHMSFLVRVSSGSFHIKESSTLEEISTAISVGGINEMLMPVDRFLDFPALSLDNVGIRPFVNGMKVDCGESEPVVESQPHDRALLRKIYDTDGRFMGIGSYISINGRCIIKPEKLFGADKWKSYRA